MKFPRAESEDLHSYPLPLIIVCYVEMEELLCLSGTAFKKPKIPTTS